MVSQQEYEALINAYNNVMNTIINEVDNSVVDDGVEEHQSVDLTQTQIDGTLSDPTASIVDRMRETINVISNNTFSINSHFATTTNIQALPEEEIPLTVSINSNAELDIVLSTGLEEIVLQKAPDSSVSNGIDEIRELTEQIFGENCDIAAVISEEFKGQGQYTNRVTIKWPEITITNSRRESHVIKDLYIQFFFNVTNKTIKFSSEDIYANRGVRSYKELKTNYLHSHARSSTEVMNWQRCCLGGNTPLAVAYAELCMEYTKETYTKFLVALAGYPYWESIEGTPYKRISNTINYSNQTQSIYEDYHSLANNYINSYFSNLNVSDLLTISDNKVQLEVTQRLTDRLKSQIIDDDYMVDRLLGIYNEDEFIPNVNVGGENENVESYLAECSRRLLSISKTNLIRYKDNWITATFYNDVVTAEVILGDALNLGFVSYLADSYVKRINDYLLENAVYEFKRQQQEI